MGRSGRRGRRRRLPEALAAIGIVLAGLAGGSAAAAPSDAAGTLPSATSTARGAGPQDTDRGTPLAPPTADDASARAALDAAAAAVATFAHPERSSADWWAALSPLLSPSAVVAYAGTDPAEVPASRVTGDARIGTSPSAFLASVFVPTDAGNYAVLLVRADAATPWLAERIIPADAGAPPSAPSPGAP